jgi:two-component system cell cycle response regulator
MLAPRDEDQGEEHDTTDLREVTGVLSFQPPAAPAERTRHPVLLVVRGHAVGQSFRLEKDQMTIGRALECDIPVEDDGISRFHARVRRVDGEFVLVDLESTNGTYMDGEEIAARRLEPGDKVSLGVETVLRFEHQDELDVSFQEEMYESRTRDALTGVYNRAYFVEALERDLAYARRHGHSLSVVLFDLDHFKHINDRYGHSGGDAALVAVTRAVRRTIRKEDLLARYGGEEFAIILRGTSAPLATLLVERVREAVASLDVVHGSHRFRLTLSAGVSSLDPGSHGHPGALIDEADERLYRAKRGGRNRVVGPGQTDPG